MAAISNQSSVTGSPTTNKANCHWWVPKNRLLRHAGLATKSRKVAIIVHKTQQKVEGNYDKTSDKTAFEHKSLYKTR